MMAWSTKNEAKACKTVGSASLRGSLDKSRIVSRTENFKMFHQYLPETRRGRPLKAPCPTAWAWRRRKDIFTNPY